MRLLITVLFGAWLLGRCQPCEDTDDSSADNEPQAIRSEETTLTQGVDAWELVKEVSGWTPQVIS